MKTSGFKFHQNRAVNEEFYSLVVKFFLGVPRGAEWPDLKKKRKILIHNGGLNPHPKFQHSSSIKKCLKIRDSWEGVRSPKGGREPNFNNLKKDPYRTVV